MAIIGMGFLGTILLQLCVEPRASKVIAISRFGRSALRIAKKMGATLALSSENSTDLPEAVLNANLAAAL